MSRRTQLWIWLVVGSAGMAVSTAAVWIDLRAHDFYGELLFSCVLAVFISVTVYAAVTLAEEQ